MNKSRQLDQHGGRTMCKVNIYELKTNLSKYIDMLETGKEKEIIICRYDKKVAKISIFNEENKKPRIGGGKGIMEDKDFELKKGFEDISQLFGY